MRWRRSACPLFYLSERASCSLSPLREIEELLADPAFNRERARLLTLGELARAQEGDVRRG